MKKQFRIMVLLLALFVSALPIISYAAFDTNGIDEGVLSPASMGEFTPRPVDTDGYVEATNSFDDNVAGYYLVTHDQGKEGLKSIEYKGTTYPLAGVLYQASESFSFSGVSATDGAKILAFNGPSNITVFFDDGKYNDSVPTNYTAFSRENNSYLGLNKDANGESTAIISKSARAETTTNPDISGLIERNIIAHRNVYFENLKFDGQNRDMVPVSYKHNKKTKKYRGEYFFNITGGHQTDASLGRQTDGLVMRDLVIENIGDTDESNNGSVGWWGPDTRRKNVAINVHYNPGQVNIENITIRNTRTASNYGVIQIQDGDATYLKDIKIDMAEAGSTTSPIKVETTQSFTALQKTEQKAVIESLTTENVKDSEYDHIYVQDYKYDYVKLPVDYKYALWNTSNGGYSSASFKAYKTLPEAQSGKAIQDLRDNYWVVDANSTNPTIDTQLNHISLVMDYTQKDIGTIEPKSPRAQIKLIGTEIPSFNIPNKAGLWQNLDGTNMPIDIVAVKDVDVDVMASKEMIPTIDNFKAVFNNLGSTNLYNFDFKSNAKYTADEVINGVDALSAIDDNDGNYPDGMNVANYHEQKDAAISKAEGDVTYNNSKFVGLVSNLNASVDKTEIAIDETLQIKTDIKAEETYTSTPTLANIKMQEADDKELYYESSDTDVATVDNTGIVTGKKPGTVTIYVKAKDTFNHGEIEKPFYKVEITVKAKAVHKFVSATADMTLPTGVTDLLPADITGLNKDESVTPTQPNTTEVSVEGGKWVFKGYQPENATVSDSNLEFVGSWEFEKATVDSISINVSKKWVGEKKDQAIIHLLANGTEIQELELTEANQWSGTFENLPVQDDQANAIVYTVSENEIEGYTTEITGDAAGGFVITNTQKTDVIVTPDPEPEMTSIMVMKRWVGQKQDHVVVHLLADGKAIQEIELHEGNWSHTFSNLPVKDDNKNKIVYTVSEKPIEGYTTEITGDAASGFVITNTQVVEECNVLVQKVWKDKSGNLLNINSGSIEVELYMDATPTGKKVVLNKDNNWSASFTNLLKINQEIG